MKFLILSVRLCSTHYTHAFIMHANDFLRWKIETPSLTIFSVFLAHGHHPPRPVIITYFVCSVGNHAHAL